MVLVHVHTYIYKVMVRVRIAEWCIECDVSALAKSM